MRTESSAVQCSASIASMTLPMSETERRLCEEACQCKMREKRAANCKQSGNWPHSLTPSTSFLPSFFPSLPTFCPLPPSHSFPLYPSLPPPPSYLSSISFLSFAPYYGSARSKDRNGIGIRRKRCVVPYPSRPNASHLIPSHFIPSYTIPSYPIPLYTIPSRPTPLYTIPYHTIPFYTKPSHYI